MQKDTIVKWTPKCVFSLFSLFSEDCYGSKTAYNISNQYYLTSANIRFFSPTNGYLDKCLSSYYSHRNPNKGTLKVPVTWPAFTRTEPQFLDINAKMNDSSIGRDMRLHFVRLWASTLPSLPSHGAADAQWCVFCLKNTFVFMLGCRVGGAGGWFREHCLIGLSW